MFMTSTALAFSLTLCNFAPPLFFERVLKVVESVWFYVQVACCCCWWCCVVVAAAMLLQGLEFSIPSLALRSSCLPRARACLTIPRPPLLASSPPRYGMHTARAHVHTHVRDAHVHTCDTGTGRCTRPASTPSHSSLKGKSSASTRNSLWRRRSRSAPRACSWGTNLQGMT